MAPSKLTTIDFGTFANVIDGQLRNSKTKYHGIDPTTKEPNWDVPVASDNDIEDAVVAGNKAYAKWKMTTWEERTQHLERFKEIFFSYEEELTNVLVKETGKPRMFGAMEVKSCAEFFDWHINMKEPQLQRIEDDEKIVVNKYIPLGVVAAIAPWNFPLLLVLAKVLPATQMGNTVIVKPSPFTPYTPCQSMLQFPHADQHKVFRTQDGRDCQPSLPGRRCAGPRR
jgi:acyl-CoA reductase-like NAD-dependent aldehyde dehydrogenase